MTPIERKLLRRTLALGTALCILVAVLDTFGVLGPIERRLYDLRARYCRFFEPPPTDKLVHVDVDDLSLDAIGRWPWPRATLAQIIDEMTAAGVRTIALDIIFPEAQEGGGDDDQRLADAIARHGRVVIAMPTDVQRTVPPLQRATRDALSRDLELSRDDVVSQLDPLSIEGRPDPASLDDSTYLAARRSAMAIRIEREFDKGPVTIASLRPLLLPGLSPLITDAPLLRLLANQYQKVSSLRTLRGLLRPDESALPQPPSAEADKMRGARRQAVDFLAVEVSMPPIAPLSRAAAATGFVDYHPGGDGVVRDVPLWVREGDRLVPQMGLSLACLSLGLVPDAVKIESARVTIPRPDGGGVIELPVRERDLGPGKGVTGTMFDVPWFGRPKRWDTMYDYPAHEKPVQHLAIVKLWEVGDWTRRVARNNATADDALLFLLSKLDDARAKKYHDAAAGMSPDDFTSRLPFIDGATKEATDAGWVEAYRSTSAKDLDADGRQFLAAFDALASIRKQNQEFAAKITDARAKLRGQLAGKSVLVGWIATAAAADFVPTSLHPVCPGVVVHGAVFNAIMTGHVWSRAPEQVTLLLTIIVGLFATFAVAFLTPLRALIASSVVAVGYAAFNGVVLFDWADTIVGVTAPLLAVIVIWSYCTLMHFVAERAERARVTSRFRSYVDPALVSYVLEHPDRAHLDGQVRELTVVFTDLAGFTTLSEKLRERTVPMLNDYMGHMVPVIRAQRGYVNKFLGDGIMFFFGAPRENPNHALDAVTTVMRLQEVMVGFNQKLIEQDLPTLKMRVGMSTGMMVVGDAGGEHASDYTVLGDSVNLGARLESANKATGTLMMMNYRTAELVSDAVLLRPIGILQVVGKSEGVMTFEPIAPLDRATDDQRKLCDLTKNMVDAFIGGQFAACIKAADELDAFAGPSKLSDLYRRLSETYLKEPPADAFDGLVTLTEK